MRRRLMGDISGEELSEDSFPYDGVTGDALDSASRGGRVNHNAPTSPLAMQC
jgi:hypothetical protein